MQQLTHPTGGSAPDSPTGSPHVSPIVWGVLLILGGFFSLMLYLGLLGDFAVWGIGLFFAAIAVAFLYLLVADTQKYWWAAIPGMTMVGLAGLIVTEGMDLPFVILFGGAAFLGWIGLGFLLVLAVRHDFWWALIPAGVMLTLAAMTYFTESGVLTDIASAAFLFMGLGVTFVVVALYRGFSEGHWWAFIPAVLLFGMGFLLWSNNVELLAKFNWLMPVALIAAGAWIVYRGLVKQRER